MQSEVLRLVRKFAKRKYKLCHAGGKQAEGV